MGFLDKIKETIGGKAGKADQAIDKAAEVIDDKTGHKHTEQIDRAAGKAKDVVEKLDGGK